jgi:uncharacterized coiled-coil protein SlyX
MRELYVAELHGDEQSSNAAAWPFVDDWAQRHVPREGDGVRHDGPSPTVTIETSSDGQRLLTLRQPDDSDDSLLWISEVALGRPDAPLLAGIRVRLAAVPGSALTPLEYVFGVPAIVRTLLREFNVLDGGERTQARFVELGSSMVEPLVAGLVAEARRLPVVVVTRTRESGSVRVDVSALARELAGIAHVRVLSSAQASWTLTELIGQSLSAWDGAVRVYFPGFTPQDDPYRHRFWLGDRVNNGLVARLRSWFGTLAASRTAEHPVHEQLRVDRYARLEEAIASSDTAFLEEYISELDARDERQRSEISELKEQHAELTRTVERSSDELETMRSSFAEMQRSMPARQPRVPAEAEEGPLTVGAVIDDLARQLSTRYYRDRVGITSQALDAGRDFSSYNSPGELLRAAHTVIEAGALYHDNKLGTTPMEYFAQRGFGYGAQPGPHIKVDECTGPDQCLRIYWEDDPETRRWSITHIGRHR